MNPARPLPLGATASLASVAILLAACATPRSASRPDADRDSAAAPRGSTATVRAIEVPPAPDLDANPSAPTDASRALWDRLQRAEAAGDELESRRVLARLVRTEPSTPEALEARVRLAEDAASRGDWDASGRWAASLPDHGLEPALEYRRRRAVALAYEGQGSWREAADAWLAVPPADGSDALPEEAREGAARSLFLAGEPDEAERALGAAPDTDARLRELVAARLDEPTLGRLIEGLPPTDPWVPWLALRLARGRCEAGDLNVCEASARRAAASPDADAVAEAQAMLARTAVWRPVEPHTVGVLLPLSGPYQRVGQAALEAIQLAVAAHPQVRLVVRDTRGDKAESAAQAEALVTERHVVAILGPIGLHESDAAASVTARYGVPHLLLSAHEEVTADRPAAFRFRVSKGEQAVRVARYAMDALAVRRVAILYPDHPAGRELAHRFWDEVERLGGEVRGVEAYDPDTRELGGVVGKLIGAARAGEGTVDFDALYLPDDALTVRRLVPFLKYWGITPRTSPDRTVGAGRPAVQLLGASGWNSPSVVDRGENLTDNAVFTTPWAHDPSRPAADRFALEFRDRYQRAPRAFHAEVYDATRLLASVVATADGTTHAERVAALARLQAANLDGATGFVAVAEAVDGATRPVLMTIDLDTLRLRDPEVDELRRRRARVLDIQGR